MREILERIYGADTDRLMRGMDALAERYGTAAPRPWVTQADAMLITYGDSIREEGRPPLRVLREFLDEHVRGAVSAVHLLPCFPYTSDDGFSVTDYRVIDPALGTWEDVRALAADFDLMLDAVVNHASVKSAWFEKFLAGQPPYTEYFITADPNDDYSRVTRPRALPLLTAFDTAAGKRHVWTTFSADQADLNYRCPDLLLEVLDILALYASSGARYIRLDAIGFLYKKQGTTCMHLEETHMLVRLMRAFLERVAPGTVLITETNVPHKDNISYFGHGDEAGMVYQFPLPPLVLFAFLAQDATRLTQWAASLEQPQPGTTFFNFLASHDGIGLRPTEGILTDGERGRLVQAVLDNGGFVSYRDNGDGTRCPYELNINYMDALARPADDGAARAAKMVAAHAILLSVVGVPGIYIHSLFGSRGDREAALASGINRRVNRARLDAAQLEKELAGERGLVFAPLKRLLQLRARHTAFAPGAAQQVCTPDARLFCVQRSNAQTGEQVLSMVNVSADTVAVDTGAGGLDLVSGETVRGMLRVPPYGVVFLLEREARQ